MVKLTLRHRHAVNKKEARHFSQSLNEAYGLTLAFAPGEVEVAQGPGWDALLQGNRVVAMVFSARAKGARARLASGLERVAAAKVNITGRPIEFAEGLCLTVRGVLAFKPKGNWFEVDMGAVPYLSNGAHAMAPGVVATAESIEQGAPVWIRDERNKRPLAVGWALMSSEELADKTAKGKCVWTLQYVSDEIWDYGEPE